MVNNKQTERTTIVLSYPDANQSKIHGREFYVQANFTLTENLS